MAKIRLRVQSSYSLLSLRRVTSHAVPPHSPPPPPDLLLNPPPEAGQLLQISIANIIVTNDDGTVTID